MSASVCRRCDLAFPYSVGSAGCPICGRRTDYSSARTPDDNWEDRLVQSRDEYQSPEAKVIVNRALRLHELGLDYDRAIFLAGLRASEGGYLIDVHRFEDLTRNGATPKQAAEILG